MRESAILLLAVTLPLVAQWTNYRDPQTPRKNETTGFTEDSWLDGFGHPRCESMRITESYLRRDFGHMDLEVNIEDSKYYKRPFGFRTHLDLMPDSDILEYVCAENEKARAHIAK
jgi:hypothetical protein